MKKVLKRLLRKIYRHREDITVKEMLEIMKTNDNTILLDVRSSQEYKEGHVARKYKHSSIWPREMCYSNIK